MKKIVLLFASILALYFASAQDTTRVRVNDKEVARVIEDSVATRVKVMDKDVVTVIEDSVGTRVRVGDEGGIEVVTNNTGDTVKIRIGRRTIKVVEGDEGTSIKTSRESRDQQEDPEEKKFPGSWAGVEFGANLLHMENYAMYASADQGFFDIDTPKSISFNLNFAEFAFSNKHKTVALVTGMGFSFMDYRFEPDMGIAKDETSGMIIPVDLPGEPKKSKLSVSYLTVPMILQVATPLKRNRTPLTLGAGVIGGLNIGSHTKVKYQDAKEKDRRNFNINPLKYDLTGRIGMGDISLFANWGMTSLFKTDKGPDIRPLTVGLTLNMN